MRQLIIQVPQGYGKDVMAIAQTHQGVNLTQFQAYQQDNPVDMVVMYISNRQVGQILEQLQEFPDAHISLFPTGVMALSPPASQAAQQVKEVEERSPIEIFLAGLQSVGSWRGFLGYAAVAGVVVWIGLYTNTTYLLTAAMLIAPFAGPAMNVAIATARGDRQLLQRSVLRYFAALAVTITVAGFLSLLLQQQIATDLMIERSQISAVAALLPIAAGAAGALNLVQSERSSLVSGAATGMLVAASLAPPAGVVGMASTMGRWDLVTDAGFLLVLQLFGINLSAALLFRGFGMTAQGSRYRRGKAGVFPATLAIVILALGGLLTWQFSNPPQLQHSSIAQRANTSVQQAIAQTETVKLVESNVRFTRSDIQGQNTLLCVVYVQRQPNDTRSDENIRTELTQAIQTRLVKQGFNVTPLVDVIVLDAPAAKSSVEPNAFWLSKN
jgi:uncharacterized hydrophobic protein (TIGR00271 family)